MLSPMPDQLTPREAEMMRHEKEQNEAQMQYGMRMKELDIEVQKLEAKWSTWLRIPLLILKLPLLILLGIAYIVHVITGNEPSDNFYNLLK